MALKKKYTTGAAPGMPCASTLPLASPPYEQMNQKTLRGACKDSSVALKRTDEKFKTRKELVDELKDADAKNTRGSLNLSALFSSQSLTGSASQ